MVIIIPRQFGIQAKVQGLVDLLTENYNDIKIVEELLLSWGKECIHSKHIE